MVSALQSGMSSRTETSDPKPRALLLRAAGTNCDDEMVRAFALAGAEPKRVHLERLIEYPRLLEEFDIIGIPGGFSYGDDIAAGRLVAPFEHKMPSKYSYYLVRPREHAEKAWAKSFEEWLLLEAAELRPEDPAPLRSLRDLHATKKEWNDVVRVLR